MLNLCGICAFIATYTFAFRHVVESVSPKVKKRTLANLSKWPPTLIECRAAQGRRETPRPCRGRARDAANLRLGRSPGRTRPSADRAGHSRPDPKLADRARGETLGLEDCARTIFTWTRSVTPSWPSGEGRRPGALHLTSVRWGGAATTSAASTSGCCATEGRGGRVFDGNTADATVGADRQAAASVPTDVEICARSAGSARCGVRRCGPWWNPARCSYRSTRPTWWRSEATPKRLRYPLWRTRKREELLHRGVARSRGGRGREKRRKGADKIGVRVKYKMAKHFDEEDSFRRKPEYRWTAVRRAHQLGDATRRRAPCAPTSA